MNSGRHECVRHARRLPAALLALAACALAAPSAHAKLSTPSTERSGSTPSTTSTERSGSTPSTTFQPFNFSTSSYVCGLDLDGTLQGAGGVGGLLAVIVPRPMGEGQGEGGTVYMPCYDANGNITEYVSTNGEVVAHYDYSPFGEQLVSSGPLADTFTHRFSTKPWCADTGLVEYQMRKYRTEIGRWMNRDPIFEKGSNNIFGFTWNSPLHHVDTNGESVIGGISFVIGIISLIIFNPDTANAPGINDPVSPSEGVKGMVFDLLAGAAFNITIKCCGTIIGKLRFRQFYVEAVQARDFLARKKPGAAAIVGVFDARTGRVEAGRSGLYIDEPTPILKVLSDKMGGIGTVTSCGNTIGCCAEFNGADEIIRKGTILTDVRFTPAIRPRQTGKIIEPCDNCLQMFKNNFSGGSIPALSDVPNALFIPLDSLVGDK